MGLIKWLTHRWLLGHHSEKIKEGQDLDHHKCASCNCGKQVRSPSRATNAEPLSKQIGALKKEKLEPGDGVAVDQFVVVQGGRLFTSSGQEREEDKFKGGTVFVDMATGKIFIEFQVSSGTTETLSAEACFEREYALN